MNIFTTKGTRDSMEMFALGLFILLMILLGTMC